ncbi:class I SAM-dependent methyltransferase [Bacteroides fragilis]|uniref:class I SAM-dependent methyltransferase n=1 Tax=Bacteroides fragilis TaxID=817 RepID=UPI002030068C|nr:class I SAM-dependent methyltransferase [Bacteroides fragilis]MCM0347408.1 class I SAM-dependent methyltransferase [Bacteroides fragilis]
MGNDIGNRQRWINLHQNTIIDDERLEPTEAIIKIFNDKKDCQISQSFIALEVGCGFGRNIKYLLDNQYVNKIIGIDQTAEAILQADAILKNYIDNDRCNLYIMDAGKNISLPNNHVDIVFDIMSAVTFITDEKERLQYWTEIKRILKPGGIFYFYTVRAEGNILDSIEGSIDIDSGTFQRKFDGMKEKSYTEEEILLFTKGMKKRELSILSNHCRAFGERKFVRPNGFWFGAFIKQ